MSSKSTVIDLTVKERIQLHLLDFTKYLEEYSVPFEVTQSGIAERVGIQLKHLSQYLKPLLQEGVIEERTAHIVGGKQRRKVCFLTGPGLMKASKIKDLMLGSQISYMTASGKLRDGVLMEVMERHCPRQKLMDMINAIGDDGILDIGSIIAAEPEKAYVDHTEEAPKTLEFVNRVKEMEEVLSLLEERKIVIIRGLAGIGKTALATTLCSKLRKEKNLFWHQTRKWDTPASMLLRIGRFLRAIGSTMLYEHVSDGHSVDLTRAEQLLEKELDGSDSLLTFDDFQHADESIIDFFSMFRNVMANTEDANILVLSREAATFYDRRAVMIGKVVGEMELKGLDFESTVEWMKSRGVENDHEEIYEKTGGHPLFLELVGSHLGRS